ncbi:MAG: hypothetical protein ACI4C7_07830 [Clostridia bacterium]
MSKTLLTEIRNIAIITAILGILQIIITAIIGCFDLSAVLGTILGWTVAIFNFSIMGIIFEFCINNSKGATGIMGFGYIARLLVIGAVIVWAMKVDYFNYICAVIPLVFPQAAIFILNIIRSKERNDNERT